MATLTRPSTELNRRDLSAPWRHIDWVLVASVLLVSVMGVTMVFSATRGAEGPADTSYLKRQAVFMVIGVGILALSTLTDYRRLRDLALPAYIALSLLLLAVVSPLGTSSKGAQAWFAIGNFQLQPSEFAKIGLIVALAALLEHWHGDVDLRRVGIASAVAGLPMALILLQPDLGTMLVFVAITVAMFLMGGVKGRHLLLLTLVGVIGVVGVLNSNVLKEYQKDRLTVFLDPESDKGGSAYNVNQSIITIQQGGLTGDGLFQGRQTQLRFVPEQQTDFIFTVVGEELGFLGAATFLGLYGLIVWRVWRAANLARDTFGQLLCVGVLAMLAFQLFESVGMTMGIMPATGIPLPFMSYGGSSTITSFVAIAVVLNVHMRRFR
ncbi:MAG: rod shape-determining protein RodA [Acidimicrobiales bacterium]|jgi:rod shape determining protein RodA|nr:rod shape-determining protein RodA [Acidimicrobiales bacterium]